MHLLLLVAIELGFFRINSFYVNSDTTMNTSKIFIKSVKAWKIKWKQKSLKFPNISQIIPEVLRLPADFNSSFFIAFACGFLLMANIIMGNDLRSNLDKLNLINQERKIIEAQIVEWKGILSTYKNYKDGYYMLAILEYRLGDSQRAYDYTNEALEIDPNYKEAKELLIKLAQE